MTPYRFSLSVDEWVVQLIEVDQYGKEQRVYWTSDPSPDIESARRIRQMVAVPHPHVRDRWIPRKAVHLYVEAEIRWRRRVLADSDRDAFDISFIPGLSGQYVRALLVGS